MILFSWQLIKMEKKQQLNNYIMIWIYRLLILLVSGTVYNVWLLRLGKATPYRGGGATSLQDEFLVYGLNEQMMYVVGGIKLLASTLLLVGLFRKQLITPAATTIAILMIGAIAMHLKVGDPLMRSLPAAMMLLMSIGILSLKKIS